MKRGVVFIFMLAASVTAGPGEGIDTEIAVTLEYIANVKGGIEEDEVFLGNIDITAELDTEAAGLWKGGTFFLYGLGNFNDGKLPSEIIGDIQATSNIEAIDAVRLYEAWYNHLFMDGGLELLLGLHDFNSEFDVMEYAAVLNNSSFGIASQISQAGPSIFPITSLALRLKAALSDNSYVLAAAYDGIPGDPDDPRKNPIKFNSGDGLFYAIEAGLTASEDEPHYKLAAGGWYHTADIEDLTGTMVDENGGAYILGEFCVYEEAEDQGLGAFAQFGNAQDDRNLIAYSIMAGVNYTGLFPSRDEDILAIGLTRAVISDDYHASDASTGMDKAETVIEAVYEALVSEKVSVRLDAQYIMDPASAPAIQDALALGARISLVY